MNTETDYKNDLQSLETGDIRWLTNDFEATIVTE